MPLYKYRVVGEDGTPEEGVIEESSGYRATALLKERGYQVNSVEALDKPFKFKREKHNLSWEDINLFNEQLLAITKSELPLSGSLKVLAEDIKKQNLKKLIEGLHEKLETGASLADAIDACEESFPAMYRHCIRAGEESGNLSGVLSHLCDYSERRVEFKSRAQESLAYPAMVIMVAIAVLVFIMVKIVPVYGEIFAEFGSSLPAPTQFLMDLSDALIYHTWSVVCGLAVVISGIVICSRLSRRFYRSSYLLSAAISSIPVIGALYRRSCVLRFTQTLNLLLSSNVPIIESLHLAASSADDALLHHAVGIAAEMVRGGTSLADAFKEVRFFKHSYCWAVANAERHGNLEEALRQITANYENGVRRQEKTVLALIEPLIIVFLGGCVAFIIISLYLPIFTLGDALTG